MPKFKVYISKCYELEVEAETPDQAETLALELPLEKWDDPFESEVIVETIEEA